MKRGLGISKKQDKSFTKIWDQYKNNVCIDFDVDNLIPVLKNKLNLNIPKGYSMLEDFVNRFDLNLSIWPIAKYAKEHYKVGLLTNQYLKMLPLIRKRKLIPDIKWNAIIDSSVVGLQKPDPEIFKLAQKKAKTKPKYILYIDNDQKHLDSASSLGWQTFLYDPTNPKKSSKKLEKLLNYLD